MVGINITPPMECELTRTEYECKYDESCANWYRMYKIVYDDYYGGVCST